MLQGACRASHSKQSAWCRIERPWMNVRRAARLGASAEDASTLSLVHPPQRCIERCELLRCAEVHPLASVDLPTQPPGYNRAPQHIDERKSPRRAICEECAPVQTDVRVCERFVRSLDDPLPVEPEI